MENSKLMNVLQKGAIGLGVVLLIASIQLSYDGFDQTVTGGNPNYALLATIIGYTVAVTFNLLEFIVSSPNSGLNTTLRTIGLFAYGYSIYMNYVGLQNLLGMDKPLAAIIAAFMDIVPEPMIAFGLGEAVMHDLFGNFGKFMTEPAGKKGNRGGGGNQQNNQPNHPQQPNQPHQNQRPQQPQQAQFKPKLNGGGGFPQGKPGQGRSTREAQFRNMKDLSDLSDTDKMRAIRRSFDE